MSPQGNLSHRVHTCAVFLLFLAAVVWLALAPVAVIAAPADRAAALDDQVLNTGVAIVSAQGAPMELRLSNLNFADQLLSGSGDEARVGFRLPASWPVAAGAALRMHFAATVIGWEAT